MGMPIDPAEVPVDRRYERILKNIYALTAFNPGISRTAVELTLIEKGFLQEEITLILDKYESGINTIEGVLTSLIVVEPEPLPDPEPIIEP